MILLVCRFQYIYMTCSNFRPIHHFLCCRVFYTVLSYWIKQSDVQECMILIILSYLQKYTAKYLY